MKLKSLNERNAGKKPKYKINVQTTTLHVLIPAKTKNECLDAIEKIVEPYKN